MVILGTLVTAIGIVQPESVIKAFVKIFDKKPGLLSINEQAILLGAQYIIACTND